MKKLNCKKIEDMLPPYLGGELTEREIKEVEEHIRSCAKCETSLKEWERCFSLLGSVPRVEAPLHLWQAIRAHLPREEKRRMPLPLRWLWVSGTAIIVLVVGLTFFKQLSQPRSAPSLIAQQSMPALSYPPSSTKPSAPLTKTKMPQPRKVAPILSRPKTFYTSSLPVPHVARAYPPPSPVIPGKENVEERVAERLQLALLSARSAEDSLERAFKALQGEKEF